MENLVYYLPLILCPLMLIVMYFFMKDMGKGEHSNKNNQQTEELQHNMNQLMEQNQQLMKEIESMKKSH